MGFHDPPRATPTRLAELADAQHGVVERDQLRALGLSDTAIRGMIRRRALLRLHRRVYAVGHRALRIEGRMLAAVLACGPGAALSHRSAAMLWELRPSDRGRIDVTATSRRAARNPLIDLHQVRRLGPVDVTVHAGVPVTTVARTLVDLAGVVAPAALERALQQAEVLGLYDHRAVGEVLARSNGRRGAAALRAALGTTVQLTRSELERRMLALCDRHGLPRPLVNTVVCGYEVDFLWPDARLIVETDGHAYHGTRRAFERDRLRDEELTVAGFCVIRVTHARLTRAPSKVAATIRALVL